MVGEDRAAPVHEQRLGLGRNLVGNFSANDVAAHHRRKLVAIGPVLRLVLDEEVELADLEGFEGHHAIAIELDRDSVEIVFTLIGRQLGAPPVPHSLEDYLPARLHMRDAVGAAAQWGFEGGRAEVSILPVVLWQHRQFAETHDQQRIFRLLEYETNAMSVEDVDPLHPLQVGAVLGVPILYQGAIGEGDVIGGNRLTVMKAGFLAQVENHPAVVIAVLH